MSDDPLVQRIERFERTVATCLCMVPMLFAGQCLAVSLGIPVFQAMFADFGSPLPALTEFAFAGRPIWILLSVGIPTSAVIMARRGPPGLAVIFATVTGLLLFLLAQFVTASLFLPVFQLGEVASGMK
jgi:hypothetical protein